MTATIACVHEDRAAAQLKSEALEAKGHQTPDRLISGIASFTKATPSSAPAARIDSCGSLREIAVPALFHGLRREGHTGVVLIDDGKKKKAVEFRDGRPISVESNLISECLGGYLVKNERCTPLELKESVRRMRAGEGQQGQILVAMKVLEEGELIEALRGHALEKFFESFSWRDGSYALHKGAHLQRGSRLALEGHPAKWLIEGVRHAYPLKQIDRFFEVHADEYLVSRPGGEDDFSEVGLSAEELAWVRNLEGVTTLGELLDQSEWARRLAFGFIFIEFMSVELAPRDEADARGIVGRVDGAGFAGASASDESLHRELADRANRIRSRDHYGVLDLPAAAEDEGRRGFQAELEYQKGEARMASLDYEGALLCFGRAMGKFPAEGEYRSHYGWCLYLCHPDNDVMLGEALEHCREGLKLAKDREKPYLLMGRLYKAMGKTGAAKKMFSRAVEIKPQCVEATRELRIMNMRRDKSQGIVQGMIKGVMKRIFRR
jgi:tetratricopeptide (TPR) repeat protein